MRRTAPLAAKIGRATQKSDLLFRALLPSYLRWPRHRPAEPRFTLLESRCSGVHAIVISHIPGPPGAGDDLSWKVRYRTFPWFFSQMSKLYRARSLLYRRQILQVNSRWKAAFAPLRPQYFRKCSSNFFAFFGKICKISLLKYFWILFTDFCSDFDEILSEFRR